MSSEPGSCSCTKSSVAPSDEYLIELIVDQVKLALSTRPASSSQELVVRNGIPLIPLGVSNRHIHLTKETFQTLFGGKAEFESLRPLYQPGEFASKHTLAIAGPKLRTIPGVRILGPLRKYDQVEVSLTDAIYLGIDPPVANSGTLDKAAPLTLIGPNGSVYLERCAIVASRHIHMPGSDARKLGVGDGDLCRVRVGGEKPTVFENVLVRTNDNWKLQIHLDTDDANAANIREEISVEFLGKMEQR
jgi:putative phosphotransacetylase